MNNALKHLFPSLLILLASNFALAQDNDEEPLKYYDVEIIVFKNDKVPRNHEYNLPTPSANQTEDALDLSLNKSILKAEKKGITPLKYEELQLHDKVNGIIKSSRYSLLVHTGWRQPGREEAESIPVWIKGGKVYGDGYSSIDQFRELTGVNPEEDSSNPNTSTPLISDPTPQSPPQNRVKGLYELEGHIVVSLSRYLHTKADLVLRKPANPVELLQQSPDSDALDNSAAMESLEGQLLLNYGLNEQRRMRSKRLHYLDHPEFGMLVLITPYEAPVPEESESDTESDTATQPVANTSTS